VDYSLKQFLKTVIFIDFDFIHCFGENKKKKKNSPKIENQTIEEL